MEHDFLCRFSGKFPVQREVWKGSTVFAVGMFHTEIRGPLPQSQFWYHFRAFAVNLQ